MKRPQLRKAEVVPGRGADVRPPAPCPHITSNSHRCQNHALAQLFPGFNRIKMATNVIPGSLDDDIYLGFWINRSFDTVRGATLTLDRTRGGLLIAFLALFVSTSGRSVWKVARCLLHFAQSSEGSNDGLHNQRQAILRNTPLLYLCRYAQWRTFGARMPFGLINITRYILVQSLEQFGK
jgi:hypothetical protein